MEILIHYPMTSEEIEEFRQLAARHGDHRVHHASSEEEAVELAPDVEVIIGHFRPAVCAAAPELRWIQSFSTGMDKFLFPEIVERDEVTISNMAGRYASQGAEHAWALLLALARGLPTSVRNQDQHIWQGGRIWELTGSTLGIVGMGGFGQEMVKRAQGYDMTIIALDPVRTEPPEGVSELRPPTEENLHDLLRRSDAVMIACPLIPETYHLIGARELEQMRPHAFLVNVTRGGIIDEDALRDALKNEQLAGAALDVVENEPLSADSPLWDTPNLLLTSHRAGASQYRPRANVDFFLEQLERYLKDEPVLNRIDKRKGF